MKRFAMLSSLALITGCASDSAESPTDLSYTADGTVVEGPSPDQPIEKRLLAEIVLPNGNIMTFSEHLDGGLEVSEQGLPRNNAVGELAEFADASPYEMFVALAPEGAIVPTQLSVDHARVVADRSRANTSGTMPTGFRVDKLPDFYAKDLVRAFNTCTDTTAWSQHLGNSTIGDNCSIVAGLDVNWCNSNYTPDLFSTCEDIGWQNCTTYMQSGYKRTRASSCGRAGTGTNQFAMGIKSHGSDDWEIWFDKDLFDGGYFYYWLTTSSKRDFWRGDVRTGTRKINRSWWLKKD